jgi:hypothetical protein
MCSGGAGMEIEEYGSIIDTVILAKELHDMDRYDIVQKQFFDTLSYDSFYENIYGVISSVFGGFYNKYDDYDDTDRMIFSDDIISRYYEMAWEYGCSHNVRHDENPFVTEAVDEARRWLSFCYSTDWKLLGHTKTRRTAKQSKLMVYVSPCDCDCHYKLAYGLLQLYRFFADKYVEYSNVLDEIEGQIRMDGLDGEMMAA